MLQEQALAGLRETIQKQKADKLDLKNKLSELESANQQLSQ
jgi:hypothetical protein